VELATLCAESGAPLEPLARLDGVEVSDLSLRLDHVSPGTFFACVPGSSRDGHELALVAAERGATALLVERPLADVSLPQVRAERVRAALGPLAHLVGAASDLAAAFAKAGLRPAVSPRSTDCPVVTVRHREASGQHVFFVFNEQQTACKASFSLGFPARAARALDPETGMGEDLPVTGNDVSLTLPADRGRVLVVPSSP